MIGTGINLWRKAYSGSGAAAYAGHNMVAFDGTQDRLYRGALPTGLPAGEATYCTIAFKVNFADFVATRTIFFCAANARIYANITTGSLVVSLAGLSLNLPTHTYTCSAATDYTVHLAIKGNAVDNALTNYSLWVNGSLVGSDVFAGGTVGGPDFSAQTNFSIGANLTPGAYMKGTVGFFWLACGDTTASYITDPTKFYNGGDVDLGTDGTGSGLAQPIIFFGGSNTAADWNGTVGTQTVVNHGTGADLWTMAADGVT